MVVSTTCALRHSTDCGTCLIIEDKFVETLAGEPYQHSAYPVTPLHQKQTRRAEPAHPVIAATPGYDENRISISCHYHT